MYTQIWNKYIPVIRILLKRTAQQGDQLLDLNRMDFERAGSARKSGYKFSIEFINGKVANVISNLPLAPDLAQSLLDDSTIRDILQNNNFTISLNTKFQLSIKVRH